MDEKEILQAARQLISNQERWTQGAAARGLDRIECYAQSNAAVCWCILGAIGRCAPNDRRALLAERLIYLVLERGSIAEFNDNATHADVLSLLDRAIAET